ncbi:TPA: dipeptide epimerase [Legionella pneumophila]|uniref:Dipeptide epimerase n=1 Tax=Legionella pneumophila TaxID=446 RepID=A0A2S6EXP2_LEGPN|nr:dipeptide epimerase [Legionella pneumophila]APF03594.1 dipeptide epimerase [Legionella pneumophila subsp. fraseri]APF06616.1 dipeptide epimerase [Legionella pneumophila subsp. fraseri]AUB69071.1 dipeptide epimerase [Legionella pneumophila]AUB72044.1 dipeptide epimerase [Legionella pneumophila]KXB23417.1 chloromuconate cycloisomerase [Legionella pneumophila]
MNIKEIHIAQLAIPLSRPFITAVRRTECVEDVVVLIKTDCGRIGYGSAASTPAITGDSTESIITAIKDALGPHLIGRDIAEFNLLLQMTDQAIGGNSSAKAAIDIALHDLFAQCCGLPLYRLLGGNTNCIDSCITISVKEVDEMVSDAVDLIQRGHKTLKIKLGLNPVDDIKRVQAIRQAVGNEVTLLVDANQGWSYEEALMVIAAFKKENLNIPLVEQPVSARNLPDLKAINEQVDCSIIADEACFSPEDALNIAMINACDGVNIKLMKSGGLEKAQAIYHIAQAAKMQIMVGCMLESPIGVTAIASFALSKPDISYADLDPIFLIRDNYILGGAQSVGNKIILADKPGLGIEGIAQGLNRIGVIR